MPPKSSSWVDVKRTLRNASQRDLLALLAELYALNRENRSFLNARFTHAGADLRPYRAMIERAVNPPIEVPLRPADGRKAVRDYRKAVGDPTGVVELLVFYVEQGTAFTLDVGDVDGAFYDSLISAFREALAEIAKAPDAALGAAFLPRLTAIVESARGMGWGYFDELTRLLNEAG